MKRGDEMKTIGEYFDKAVAENSDKIYMIFKGDDGELEHISYNRLRDEVHRVANGLIDAGVNANDRIAIVMNNHPDYVYLMFALAKIGAAGVTVNTGQRGDSLIHIMNSSKAKMLILDEEYVPVIESIEQSISIKDRFIHASSKEIQGYMPFSSNLVSNNTASPPPVDIDEKTLIAIMFTSGTTSLPKGVKLPHYAHINTGFLFNEVIDSKPDYTIYTCLPLFHCNCQELTMMGTLLGGMKMVLATKFNYRTFWDEMREFNVTEFNYLGALLNNLYVHRDKKDRDNPVKIIMGGGLSSTPELWKDFEEYFGLRVVEGYGLTETNTLCIYNRPDNARIATVGQPLEEVEVKVIDPETNEDQPMGKKGELCIREKVPNCRLCLGYLDEEKTRKAWDKEGWFHTGDICSLDEGDFVKFHGRFLDMFRAGGENVSTAVVEAAILKGEDVAAMIESSAYIGVESKYGGEDEVGFLYLVAKTGVAPQTRDGKDIPIFHVQTVGVEQIELVARMPEGVPAQIINPEAIIEYLIPKVFRQAVPTYIQFIDSIPMTANGRPKKNLLKAVADRNNAWERVFKI